MFRVVNQNPEARIVNRAGHKAPSSAWINVEVLGAVCELAVRGGVAISYAKVRMDRFDLQSIDLLGLCARHSVSELMSRLVRWTAATPRVQPALALEDLGGRHGELDALPSHELSVRQEEAGALSVASVGQPMLQEVGSVLRSMLEQGVVRPGGRLVPWVSSPAAGLDISFVNALAERKILHCEADEFGDLHIAVCPERLQFDFSLELAGPVRDIMRVSEVSGSKSKLEMAAALVQRGVCDRVVPDAWRLGDPRTFWRGAMRHSASYFTCLLQHDRILGKGISEIKHKMVEGYYVALLQCGDLAPLEARSHDLRRLSNKAFFDFMRGKPLPETEQGQLAIVDVEAALAIEDGPLAQDMVALHGDGIAAMMRPVRIEVREVANVDFIEVKWDGFSHSSGIQRGYTRCLDSDHEACYRYMQVNRASSRKEVCLTLSAWAVATTMGQISREEHQRFQPSRRDIDEFESVFLARPLPDNL